MSAQSYDELHSHIGHDIACVEYGDGLNVAVECVTCSEILLDFDEPNFTTGEFNIAACRVLDRHHQAVDEHPDDPEGTCAICGFADGWRHDGDGPETFLHYTLVSVPEVRAWVEAHSNVATTTYAELIEVAKGLLCEQIRDPEGEANPEYTRAICELIGDAFPHRDLGERKLEVADDIGVPRTAL